MKIVVASCLAYRDAWTPFTKLFMKFWERCPYVVKFITDEKSPGQSWCSVVSDFSVQQKDSLCLLQEDFFLNEPVRQDVIEHGLKLLERGNVGAVRLYPCPGATEPSDDPCFGRVARHTAYRTSCQATIWKPEYLHAIASRFNTPSEFELEGSPWASTHLPSEVLAFKSEIKPWPISYYCSAISRGKWEPAALEFCRQQGIEVDTSMREVA